MPTPKIAVVGISGRWSTEILGNALAKQTGSKIVVDLGRCVLDYENGTVRFGDLNLCELDAVVVKKLAIEYSPHLFERIEMLHMMEKAGVRVCSRPSSIAPLIDRAMGTRRLRDAEIPMPPTILTEDLDAAVAAVERFGEVVAKPLYSTKARGMRLIARGPNARRELAEFQSHGNPVMYLQKRIDLAGRDLGIVFLGGEYLTTYARVQGSQSWSTSTASGGHYEAFDPPKEFIDLAHRAQREFALDFTCVDVVETDAGPCVFEVSAFGGFSGIYDACNLDIATLYADYVVQQVRR